jgi:hypothetical protein
MNSRTTDRPFDNPTSQSERAAILKVEADRAINSLRAQTEVLTPSGGGRFARALGQYTIGSEEVPNYPGASAPWSGPQVGLEPPFPEDINYVEVCGTPAEVERAAAIAAAAEAPPSVGMTSSIPDSGAAADFSIGSAVNSAGQSPATSVPQLPDVGAVAGSPTFSKPSFRRIG